MPTEYLTYALAQAMTRAIAPSEENWQESMQPCSCYKYYSHKGKANLHSDWHAMENWSYLD